jgi:hypothetical protein
MNLWRRAVAWDDPQVLELGNERIAVVEELRGIWGRMEIRFPEDSDVRQRFNERREALDAYSMAVLFGHESGRPYVQETAKVEQRGRLARQAADRWLEAARAAAAALDYGESSGELG